MYNKKADLLQAWSGPEGYKKLRFPDFVTTAQDGGKVVSLTHLPPLPPGNAPGTHFCSRLAYIYIYIYIYIYVYNRQTQQTFSNIINKCWTEALMDDIIKSLLRLAVLNVSV